MPEPARNADAADWHDASELDLRRSQIDRNAADVLTKLKAAGFQAWLVGGCVRDLLIGARPKDFDVVTDARPEQVRRIFRRSRLVGRRFRITHVRYGRNLIEVSTFRRAPDASGPRTRAHGNGILLHDNDYGTLEEDVFRRDFTINALYYDPEQGRVLDRVGGVRDIRRRRLRMIGKASDRLREDPVRLLRAVRFQAKTGFKLDRAIRAEVATVAPHLREIPAARLFDEFCKLFLSGQAEETWRLLTETAVSGVLFPATRADDPLVRQAMQNGDERVADGRSVTPGFLLSALLWQDWLQRTEETIQAAGDSASSPAVAAEEAAVESIRAQRRMVGIPRRHAQFAMEVWQLQQKLEQRHPGRVTRLLGHTRFRAAYDFLVLRAQVGLGKVELADWWTQIQAETGAERQSMIDALKPVRRRARRRSRSKAARKAASG